MSAITASKTAQPVKVADVVIASTPVVKAATKSVVATAVPTVVNGKPCTIINGVTFDNDFIILSEPRFSGIDTYVATQS